MLIEYLGHLDFSFATNQLLICLALCIHNYSLKDQLNFLNVALQEIK